MPTADSSKPARVNENLAKLLAEVDALLPRGAYAAIAPMVCKSDEYVRLFFKGHISISAGNIKILDAADKYLEKLKRDREAEKEIRAELESKAAIKVEALKNNLNEDAAWQSTGI